ncbi:MAG: DNA-3-methyladenine glycosylase 2 family protein [Lachnospiraceae bacterium]|jgi:N-glycosylase/DNA lyase|nr:DNA-3-methyladenine glycosylase 2 family protein [Lachnospiraceae bacterium]
MDRETEMRITHTAAKSGRPEYTAGCGEVSLGTIADSGQCFRWQLKCGSPSLTYRIIAFGRAVEVSQTEDGKGLVFHCTEEEFKTVWENYFDMKEDYAAIRAMVDPSDTCMKAAAEACRGLRILRQDPFETLITFILSQRKNIPAIRGVVDALCCAAGEKITVNGRRTSLCAFPAPWAIAALSGEQLEACRFGYRAQYVRAAAESFASGKYNIEEMQNMNDADLSLLLNGMLGVGPKVAACTMLFGFHRMNAFPKDVWILRALKEHYPCGYDAERYSPYNGVMQQYLFMYERLKHQ